MLCAVLKRFATTDKFLAVKKLSGACQNGQSQKFTVAVEGNIGSGKTTLLRYFNGYPSVKVIQEPVDQWRNVDGQNLLELMYNDVKRWSFTFQSYVQLSMAKMHLLKHDVGERVKLMERSIYSARYCFVENHYQSGNLSQQDYIVLSKWFEFLISDTNMHLDLIVYLQTDPLTVYQKIQARGRQEEKGISLEYLTSLHILHEDWLIRQKTFKVPCPILVLDGNCSIKELEKLYLKHSNEILFYDPLTTVGQSSGHQ